MTQVDWGKIILTTALSTAVATCVGTVIGRYVEKLISELEKNPVYKTITRDPLLLAITLSGVISTVALPFVLMS